MTYERRYHMTHTEARHVWAAWDHIRAGWHCGLMIWRTGNIRDGNTRGRSGTSGCALGSLSWLSGGTL